MMHAYAKPSETYVPASGRNERPTHDSAVSTMAPMSKPHYTLRRRLYSAVGGL